ncbi:hypothetical protein GCM10008941_38440 [Rhizomicrobium palustre]
MIQIMFGGDAGVQGANIADRDFADERGFSNNNKCAYSARHSAINVQAMGGKHERKISRYTYSHSR